MRAVSKNSNCLAGDRKNDFYVSILGKFLKNLLHDFFWILSQFFFAFSEVFGKIVKTDFYVSRMTFLGKKLREKTYKIIVFFTLSEKFSARLSKLHSTSLQEHCGKKLENYMIFFIFRQNYHSLCEELW